MPVRATTSQYSNPAYRSADGLTREEEIELLLEVVETIRLPGEALTTQQIADVLGVTRQRVREMERAALNKLRATARGRMDSREKSSANPRVTQGKPMGFYVAAAPA